MALAERAFATGEVQTHEYEMRSPDGDTMYSEAASSRAARRVGDDRPRRHGEATDGGAKPGAPRSAPGAVFRLTRDGIYLDFRPPEGERQGIDPTSFLGTSIHDALPPAVATRVLEAAGQAFETGNAQTVESEMELEGSTFHLEARIVPSGENEFVMIVRDVSERVAQQRQIEGQNEFLEAIADTTSGLLCNILPDGRIGEDNVNLPLRNLTGYAQGELDGRRFSEALVAPEDAPAAERAIAEVAAGRDPGEQESRWLTNDGRELIVAWTCTPLPEVEGEPRKLLDQRH